MNRISRLLAIVLTTLVLVALGVPALATESESEPESETTETTLAPEPVFENGEPAIIIPPAQEETVEQPWTARFIYPTIVAVTILLLIFLAIWYNRNIRHKYEVAPE